MADGIRFGLNTTLKDAKWVRGGLLEQTVRLTPEEVRSAVLQSMQPGLMALQRNVQQVRAKTGRLRRSPAIVTRKYGKAPFFTVVGLVGYRSGVAPHAISIERGTPPRFNRGKVAARRFAWSAFFQNREIMEQALKSQLETLVQKALAKVT